MDRDQVMSFFSCCSLDKIVVSPPDLNDEKTSTHLPAATVKVDAPGASAATAAAPAEKVVPPGGAKVSVFIASARGLRAPDWSFSGTKSTPLVRVAIHGRKTEALDTQIVEDGSWEPTWNEELSDIILAKGESLEFTVFEKADGKNDILGIAVLENSKFEAAGFIGELPLKGAGEGLKPSLFLKVKLAGKEYPTGLPAELKIVLKKTPGQELGLSLDIFEKVNCLISAVKEKGIVSDYNSSVESHLAIRESLYLVACNGIEDAVQLVEALKKSGATLNLTLRRSHELTVHLVKSDGALKMNLHHVPDSSSVLITAIGEGPVTKWNTENPDRQVKVGDRIVAVNGQRGLAKDLYDSIKAVKGATFTISRPAEATYSGFYR